VKQKIDLAELANVTGSRRTKQSGHASAKATTRVGTRSFTVHVPHAVKQQIEILAAEHDTPIQQIFFEAMNDLFAKYGKPEIAPVNRKEGQG
jgi:hypothetical protein